MCSLLAVAARAQKPPTAKVQDLPMDNPTTGFPGKDDQARSPVLYTKLINNRVRGYSMTGGTSFYDGGGSVRRFTLTAPLASPISGATATFSARIADGSYNLNLGKHQGPQSLLLVETVAQSPDRGLLFAGTTSAYMPKPGDPSGTIQGITRSVSLILTEEASPFGETFPVPQTQGVVPVSHLPSDYLSRNVILGIGTDDNKARADRFILFQDR